MTTLQDPEVGTMLTRAGIALLLDEPFFGVLLYNLKIVEDLNVSTLCVSRRQIRYNPKFIRTLSAGQIKAALAHEVGHCVYDTMGRRGARDHRKWNIATDYTINEMLKDAGFELGEGWLYSQAFVGMSADHIYELLPPPDKNGNHPGTGDPGGAMDDVDETPGDGDLDDMTPTDWKMAVVGAANEAKQRGKLPGQLARFVEEVIGGKVDWRALLRQFATERSRDDYSWSRPNRRMMQYGLCMPSLHSESMGEMLCVIDTSGSIDQATLNAFGAEISAIHATSRPSKLYVIYCDSRVNHVDEFTANDQLHFDMHGGGGTDFRPPFAYVNEHDLNPTVGVYLTDMYGSFPEQAPGFPFMWCATTDVKAPWGETLRIEI